MKTPYTELLGWIMYAALLFLILARGAQIL